MAIKLLNVGKLPPSLLSRLSESYEVIKVDNQPTAEQFLKSNGSGIVALTTSAAIGVSNAILDHLPDLQVISSFGVGLDKIDVKYARSRGVAVGYTPDVLNDCVADLAFGLLIDVARSMTAADRFLRNGLWESGAFPLARKVSGAKLGIVGMGRIGRTIAKRSTGFDMIVKYHTRTPVSDLSWTYEKSLPALAEWADFLVVITAGGEGTKHLINAEVLRHLGRDGYLINVSRGSVVDEEALLDALKTHAIAGAALDVFQNEPQVPNAFMGLENVVLLPHIASATRETRQAMADRVFDNLSAFFSQGKPLTQALN